MLRISIGLILTATLYLASCNDMFVRLNIYDQLPEPVIHMERELTISQFNVSKVIHLNNGELQIIEYWGVAAKNSKDEKSIDEIKYGHVPGGYYEFTTAKVLDYGYYYVNVKSTTHSVAGGAFAVVRGRKGKSSVLSIDEPYGYKDTIVKCLDDFLYDEINIINNCLKNADQKKSE